MTPDRDALVARRPRPAGTDPVEVSPQESRTVEARLADSAAEMVDAVRRVPAPRPEVLARVLEGLRELPPVVAGDRAGADVHGSGAALPLPRRRS